MMDCGWFGDGGRRMHGCRLRDFGERNGGNH